MTAATTLPSRATDLGRGPGRHPPAADRLARHLAQPRHDYGRAVVLSVPPLRFPVVRELVNELASRRVLSDRFELSERLPAAVGAPGRTYVESTLR